MPDFGPGPVDPTEHLSPDHMATRQEALFLADALAAQAQASRHTVRERGRCANCGAACLPLAVYCDADCRADHERRERAQRRQGGCSVGR